MPTPIEVYNKKIKKRAKEKTKKHRKEARDLAKLLQEPEKLKEELTELSHKAIIGRIDQESLQRKEKLEKLWKQHHLTTNVNLKKDDIKEEDDTEESSDDSSSSSSDEGPKCVIEIQGEAKKPIKKGFHDPEVTDEFALELLSHAPALKKRDNEEIEKQVLERKKEVEGKLAQSYIVDPGEAQLNENESSTQCRPKHLTAHGFPPPNRPGNTTSIRNPVTDTGVSDKSMGVVINRQRRNTFTNAPQPPRPINVFQQSLKRAPPPPQKSQQSAQNSSVPRREEKEEKVDVPLSRYLVPTQLRINRNH